MISVYVSVVGYQSCIAMVMANIDLRDAHRQRLRMSLSQTAAGGQFLLMSP